jgi:acetyl-CoA carboxylase biotin carboxyl carrier protein
LQSSDPERRSDGHGQFVLVNVGCIGGGGEVLCDGDSSDRSICPIRAACDLVHASGDAGGGGCADLIIDLDAGEGGAGSNADRRVSRTPAFASPEQLRADDLDAISEEGLLKISSPMLGTFYRRPAPGSPPYVEEGTFVKEDDTVCLLEVMKVFNSVKAGVKGHIAKVCAESGDLVEYGQTLFLVKPADRVEEKKS